MGNGSIAIFGGETDGGKSLQSLLHNGSKRVLDTENRIPKTLDFHRSAGYLSDEMMDRIYNQEVDVRECMVLFENTDKSKNQIKYQPDFYSSYLKLREEIELAIEESDQFDILVIDGISPIRKQYCLAKWYVDNPDRKQPNEYDWRPINEDARQLLEPLIHLARMEDKTIIFTAQATDEYRKDVLVGRSLDTKDWCGYNVDLIVELNRPIINGKIDLNTWVATCTKSLVGGWEMMVTHRILEDVYLEVGL